MNKYQVNIETSVQVCFSPPLKQCPECYSLAVIMGEKKTQEIPFAGA